MMHLKNIFLILLLLVSANTHAIGQNTNNIKNDKKPKQAELFYNTGLSFGRSGKLDSALYYTQYAVNLYENAAIIDSTPLAYSYQNLGIINKLLGKYNDAITCYNKSEEIYILKNRQPLLAYIYGNKANIYFIQQDYTKAKNFYSRAMEIFVNDSIKYKKQLASSYNNLGNIYRKETNNQKAIICYNKSLKLKGNKGSSYTTYGNLATCYKNLNDYKTADKYYKAAIKTAKLHFKDENIKVAIQFLNYGYFLNTQDDLTKALTYFQKALSIYKKNYGEKHPNISRCYNAIGNYHLKNMQLDSALFYFQQSLIALSPEFNDTSLSSNPEISQVLSKTHLLKSLKNKAYALSELALQNKNIKYYKLSLATYKRVNDVINKIRSGYLSEESKLFLAENEFETFSNALQTSYELYKLTNDKKYLATAFNYSESGKSAILTETMKNMHALNIGGIPDSLINEEKELEKSIWTYEELIYEENKKKSPDKNNLGYWNKYLFEEKQEYSDLLDYLENNFKKYHSLKHQSNTISIEDLQATISRKESIVEFFLSDENLYTFLIQRNKVFIYKTDIDSVFNNHLGILLESISNNNFSHHGYNEFAQFQESSFYIYNKLFHDIEDKIINSDLIIIPDGALAYLPFEALTTENKNFQHINYKKLSYFLYSNTISYSHSAGFILNNISYTKTAKRSIGAFAPSYDNINNLHGDLFTTRQQYRENLFPLKGIKEEVLKVTELIDGDKYLDMEASEKKFKEVAHTYDILHLAMHTIINDQNPMYSKMAFTQTEDSTEDGFLNTYELYNMKLNSRMAVLSSCNSGSGKMQRGEGVMSMARGFIYSGCPSIIMTLWSVEDKSGVRLMTNFYENLIKGKTKSESLSLSKLNFIANADQLRAHPYFWSGYVVIGNNNALFTNYSKYLILIGITFLFIVIGLYLYRKLKKWTSAT